MQSYLFSIRYIWIGARLTESMNMNKTKQTERTNQSKLNRSVSLFQYI